MSLKPNYVYSQMKENLGKTLVRQITTVMERIDLLYNEVQGIQV